MADWSEGLARVGAVLLVLLPWALWCAWWLGAVNWRKMWPMLAEGGWAPAVLLLVMGAAAWTTMAPQPCGCLGSLNVPNGWWQFGAVGLLAALALFCGWLQGYFGWTPREVSVEPPPAAHHDDHAAHGHHDAH